MPLSDFVRTLKLPEDFFARHFAAHGQDQPYVTADGRVFLVYANIRLESHFLPVLETRTGKLFGHAAEVHAYGLSSRLPLLPEAVFVLPSDDAEFGCLDRLVRTLHALNYLVRPARGNLLLPVHARHVLSVPNNHGLAFEEILRPCGMFPEQVTLEIDINGLEEVSHLIRAVDNYRSRGYGIAVSHFGRSSLDFGLLRALRPELVKLDPLLLASSRPLARIIDNLHQIGAQVVAGGRDLQWLQQSGLAEEIDLLQAHQPVRRLLHVTKPGPVSARAA